MTEIEKKFSTLPDKDRETIISYGASLRLTSLKKRFFLADQKVKYFEKRHWEKLKLGGYRMMLTMQCMKITLNGVTGQWQQKSVKRKLH